MFRLLAMLLAITIALYQAPQRASVGLGTTDYRHSGAPITSLSHCNKDTLVSVGGGQLKSHSLVSREAKGFRIDADVVLSASSLESSVVAVGTQCGVETWDATQQKQLWTHKAITPTSIAVSESGQYVASTFPDSTLCIWHAASGDLIHKKDVLDKQGKSLHAYGLTFSPDGSIVAYAGSDRTIGLVNVKTGLKTVLGDGAGNWKSIAFSRDNKFLLCSRKEKPYLILIEIETGKKQFVNGSDKPVLGLAFSPFGDKYACIGGDLHLRLIDYRTHQLLWSVPLPAVDSSTVEYCPVTFSRDGKRVATGGYSIGCWSVSNGAEVLPDKGHNNALQSVGVNSEQLVSLDSNSMRAWRAATGAQVSLKQYKNQAKGVVCLSAGIVVRADSGVVGYSIQTGEIVFQQKATHPGLLCIDVSPDCKMLALGGDGVSAWSVDSGRMLTGLDTMDWSAICISASPQKDKIVAGCFDGHIRLLDVSGGKVVPVKEHEVRVQAVCYSLSGKYFASGDADGKIALWSSKEVKVIRRLQLDKAVSALAISENGDEIAGGDTDGNVLIWRTCDGKVLYKEKRHLATVTCLRFSDNGKMLASGSSDTTARLIRISDVPE